MQEPEPVNLSAGDRCGNASPADQTPSRGREAMAPRMGSMGGHGDTSGGRASSSTTRNRPVPTTNRCPWKCRASFTSITSPNWFRIRASRATTAKLRQPRRRPRRRPRRQPRRPRQRRPRHPCRQPHCRPRRRVTSYRAVSPATAPCHQLRPPRRPPQPPRRLECHPPGTMKKSPEPP